MRSIVNRYQHWFVAMLVVMSLSCASAQVPQEGTNCPTDPVRPGGDVSLPVAIHRVQPEKPAGVVETGKVILEMVIGTDGSPRDVVVLETPHPELGLVSVEAARDWQFRPATCHGTPVAVIFNIQITFH
jgi:TonB family protein